MAHSKHFKWRYLDTKNLKFHGGNQKCQIRNCQIGTFDWNLIFLGPNTFIWSALNVPLVDFFKNVSFVSSFCIFEWCDDINAVRSPVFYASIKSHWLILLYTLSHILKFLNRPRRSSRDLLEYSVSDTFWRNH